MLNYLAVFEGFVCTSKPQTWHKPHDDKIKSLEIQSLQVDSYKKRKVMIESTKDMRSSNKTIKKTKCKYKTETKYENITV